MKYLCLVYYDENEVYSMPREEWRSLVGECLGCVEGLQRSGHFVAGEALLPVATARTVRVRKGRVSTTDGPFAETAEQLAGFYLIEGRDLDDAVEQASKIPPARLGSVEVRPVRDLLQE